MRYDLKTLQRRIDRRGSDWGAQYETLARHQERRKQIKKKRGLVKYSERARKGESSGKHRDCEEGKSDRHRDLRKEGTTLRN